MLNLYNINIHCITKSIPDYFFPVDNRALLNDPQVRSGGFISTLYWMLAMNDSLTLS